MPMHYCLNYAMKCTSAGASRLHVEAAMAEAGVLLSDQTDTQTAEVTATHCALELLQVRHGLG